MASYWYSTNGMDQKRLSNRHLTMLDQAFERRSRVQIYDDEAFGHSVPAIANPFQGTMTAGDIHYGLYRHPSLWKVREPSLDTLILMDSGAGIAPQASAADSLEPSSTSRSRYNAGHTDPSVADIPRTSSSKNNRDHISFDARDIFSSYRFSHRRRQAASDDHCTCCIIS